MKKIPKNSTLVVEHAYGNNKNIGLLFDKDLEKFLSKNKLNIDNVIFTGDIFFKPCFSSTKVKIGMSPKAWPFGKQLFFLGKLK